MNDLSLLQDFINETTEHLEELEKNLLYLETDPENNEILNEIFRSLHTIKGASEYLAMTRIADLSHKLENLLDLLRTGKKAVSSEIIMFLIQSNDRIGMLISEIDQNGMEKSEINDLLETLETIIPENNQTSSAKVLLQAESDPVSSLYDEEYDKELFDIYIKQLEQNINRFITLLTRLEPDSDAEVLDGCIELADSMKASANYMGYEELIQIHEAWISIFKEWKSSPGSPEKIIRAIRPGIDKTLGIFPSLCSDELDLRLSNLAEGANESPDRDVPHDDFDNMIDDMFADMLPETEHESASFEQVPVDYPATCIYEEEHDRELFTIFIDQLREHIDELKAKADSAILSDNFSDSVDHCLQVIQRLKSSALYMGYEELCGYYDFWTDRLDSVKGRLTNGETILVDSFIDEEISARIEGVLKFFPPGIIDKQTEKHAPLKHSVDNHYAEREENVVEPAGGNTKLYDQLSMAFDSKQEMYQIGDDDWSIQEMEKELFSFSDITDDFSEEGLHPIESRNSVEKEGETLLSGNYSETSPRPSLENIDEPTVGPEVTELYSEPEHVTTDRRPETPKPEEERAERMVQKSVRVDAEKIDSLMNQVGELVVSRAWFSQLFNEIKTLQYDLVQNNNISPREIKLFRNFSFKLSEATTSLGRLANELQEGVMKVRMLPIERLFNRLPRQIRDLAQRSSKEVELRLAGEETELDKIVIEKISDPLIHIIRNAVDHGIESPEERKQKNKPEKGRISLNAYHESNHVVIEISDDGKGLNRKAITQKALQKKLISEEELSMMTEREIYRLILTPGFSTAEKVTHTSGRGVGMDVVKKNIEKLNGTIDIYSVEGKETRFRIKIPLTLAIIPALLVKVGAELFTIPLSTVEETLKLNPHEISTIEGMEVVQVRNETLPIVRLGTLFRMDRDERSGNNAFVVVVSNGVKKTGLVVDTLVGQEEVVIKPLEDYLQEKSGFSGATILGDGSISLILDIYELVNISVRRHKARKEAAAAI